MCGFNGCSPRGLPLCSQVFKQFDADGDSKLDIYELARAFRALGLPKRDGEKMDVDKAMFKSFDTNGDGFVSLEELEKGLKPKTRKKIEEKLDGGWKFDEATWKASVERHNAYNMKDIFKQFDTDGDSKLTIHEFARAFRAFGLPKRDGSKMEMDHAMFKSFDTNVQTPMPSSAPVLSLTRPSSPPKPPNPGSASEARPYLPPQPTPLPLRAS